MVNTDHVWLQCLWLVCAWYTVSAGCPPCSINFYQTTCLNDFGIIAQVTNKTITEVGINYQLGFTTVYIYKQGSGFKSAEKVIRSKYQDGSNVCGLPETEFEVGHYYLFMGRVVTDGKRNWLAVKRCGYMDIEDITSNSRALEKLSQLKSKRFCPTTTGKSKWKWAVGKMNNVFEKGGR